MSISSTPRNRLSRVFLLFAFALVVHLAGTWILPLIDRDETFYAEVSREMNERGDYVVPYLNGKIWLEKPPLLYWCQCASYRLFGDNDFAARLPGAVASALTALVILGFGSRLHGPEIGWRAAIAFTVCLEMLIFGKAGITDMPAVLFTTLAAWAGWELLHPAAVETRTSRRWWWIFYLSLSGAFLAKGPLAVLPLAGVIVYGWWAKVPSFFQRMKLVRGLALSAGIGALWFVPAFIQTKGALYSIFIQQQIIDRSTQVSQGHGASSVGGYLLTLPFYFVLAFAAFFPWSIWFPAAFRRFRRERSPADVYLVSGILVTFVLFSIVRTKLLHYTLPAFPLLACAVAPVLPSVPFVRWSIGMTALNFALAFGAFPIASRYCAPREFLRSGLLRSDMAFASVEYQEPSLVWYLRKQVRACKRQLKARDIASYMKEQGPRFCVMPKRLLEGLTVDPAWKVVNARGLDVAKGKWVELAMLVKEQ
jgi:4-amino-4-deoxy-L-arabinose transferase-like glycosyltransferase